MALQDGQAFDAVNTPAGARAGATPLTPRGQSFGEGGGRLATTFLTMLRAGRPSLRLRLGSPEYSFVVSVPTVYPQTSPEHRKISIMLACCGS